MLRSQPVQGGEQLGHGPHKAGGRPWGRVRPALQEVEDQGVRRREQAQARGGDAEVREAGQQGGLPGGALGGRRLARHGLWPAFDHGVNTASGLERQAPGMR